MDHPQMSPRAMLLRIAKLASDLEGSKVNFKQISIRWGDEPYPLFKAVLPLAQMNHVFESRACGTSTQAIDELLQLVEQEHDSAYQEK